MVIIWCYYSTLLTRTVPKQFTNHPWYHSSLKPSSLLPLQHNQAGTAAEVNYVELELPLEAERPGYSVSGADPRIYAARDHRRSLSTNPPAAQAVAASANDPGDLSPSLDYRRGTSHFHHHASSIPNLYAMLDYRRGGTTTTTTTIPNLYATLPHRRDYSATSMSTTTINISPPGFRDIRMSLRTPLVRRPSESAV